MTLMGYCEASITRGEWSSIRTEACGKVAKTAKRCLRGHSVYLCGIHARAKYVLHFQDRNLKESPAGWIE